MNIFLRIKYIPKSIISETPNLVFGLVELTQRTYVSRVSFSFHFTISPIITKRFTIVRFHDYIFMYTKKQQEVLLKFFHYNFLLYYLIFMFIYYLIFCLFSLSQYLFYLNLIISFSPFPFLFL